MSDTENSGYKATQTDLNHVLDAQGKDKTLNRVPFSETIKALDHSTRKSKMHLANHVPTTPPNLQAVQTTTTATKSEGNGRVNYVSDYQSVFHR